MKPTSRPKQCKMLRWILPALGSVLFLFLNIQATAQEERPPKKEAIRVPPALMKRPAGKPIVIETITESLDDRFARTITLDVREMNVIDVIKFLALKGNFNMVTSGLVEGRVTLYLKNVNIKDALDIILISNKLAYYVENNIVHVVSEPEYETLFGKKYRDKMEVSIVHLNYAKPSYVMSTLENIKSGLGRVIIDEDTGSVVLIDTKQAIKEMKTTIRRMEVPVQVVSYALQYAKADVVAEKLKARIDSNAVGSITVDERSNKLIIRALPGRRKEVEKMIKSMDTPTKEVMVDAKVLQVTFKPQFDFGVDWDLDFKDSADKHLRRVTLKNVFLDESNPPSPLGSNFTRIGVGDINVNHFQIFLRSLKQVSDTKILSNPQILVTNNSEAKIHIGDTVPYIISTTSGTGDNAITSEDVRFVDVGIKLNVTPTINDDGYVTMHLRPEISTVIAQVASKGGGIPQIEKTEVETTVIVKDGMTIMLGGLKKENKVHIERGIPFLMDIPFLGKLFEYNSDSIQLTEIIIFITPHIVRQDQDYMTMGGVIKPAKISYRERDEDKIAPLTIKD